MPSGDQLEWLTKVPSRQASARASVARTPKQAMRRASSMQADAASGDRSQHDAEKTFGNRSPPPPTQSDLHGNMESAQSRPRKGIAGRRRTANDGPLFTILESPGFERPRGSSCALVSVCSVPTRAYLGL